MFKLLSRYLKICFSSSYQDTLHLITSKLMTLHFFFFFHRILKLTIISVYILYWVCLCVYISTRCQSSSLEYSIYIMEYTYITLYIRLMKWQFEIFSEWYMNIEIITIFRYFFFTCLLKKSRNHILPYCRSNVVLP